MKTGLKQQILFLISRIVLRVYNFVIVTLVIIVMCWHRAWTLKLRQNG